tara:strand:+ start:13010 stop:14911 length:1902 start_codon:yes stop_codon:yes gene_type:complete
MRYQENIYVQTNVECLRNKAINNVNCSSDIDVFTPPTMELTPDVASGNTCVSRSIYFSGISYDTIQTVAVSACTSASKCFDFVTWELSVGEDGVEVYAADFWTGTTVTGNTPTDVQLGYALDAAFTSLGYYYTKNGMVYNVTKPYGVELLDVSLCLDITLSTSGTCSKATACSATCVTIASQLYPIIDSSTTGVIIVNEEVTGDIDLVFDVTFSEAIPFSDDHNMRWRYEIYRFDDSITRTFHRPLVDGNGWYDKSDIINKGFEISANTKTIETDGDYILKGYFEADVQTKYRNELGDKVNTTFQNNTGTAGLYRREFDNYFVVNYSAATPYFTLSNTNTPSIGSLRVIGYVLDGTTNTFTLGNEINGSVLVALNGITLARGLDYTLTAVTTQITTPPVDRTLDLKMTLLSPAVSGDVLTYAYVATGDINRLTNDVINITSPIVSGATGGQGSNDVYYNTTEGKYELYTQLTPDDANDIYITINGVTLLNGVDYYQSITNRKRIILIGTIVLADIINVYYGTFASITDNIYSNTQRIPWVIAKPPKRANGVFTLEISTDSAFTNITQSATTDYVVGRINYDALITFNGTVGTTYYYRVKNAKNYVSMCGDIITTVTYSETVPIIVRTNSINSY